MLKLYQTSKGYILNADVNGALNILRKSNVEDLEVLYSKRWGGHTCKNKDSIAIKLL